MDPGCVDSPHGCGVVRENSLQLSEAFTDSTRKCLASKTYLHDCAGAKKDKTAAEARKRYSCFIVSNLEICTLFRLRVRRLSYGVPLFRNRSIRLQLRLEPLSHLASGTPRPFAVYFATQFTFCEHEAQTGRSFQRR